MRNNRGPSRLLLWAVAGLLAQSPIPAAWAEHAAQPAGEHSGIVTPELDTVVQGTLQFPFLTPALQTVVRDSDLAREIADAIDGHFQSAIFTFLQCNGGGFIDDLVAALPADRAWSISAAARHDECAFANTGAAGFSHYGRPHTTALGAGKTARQAFEAARDTDLSGPKGPPPTGGRETPQYHSSGTAGDGIKVGVGGDSYHAILYIGLPDLCDDWNETVTVYQMLKNRGYPVANIVVMFGNGTRNLRTVGNADAVCTAPAGAKPGDLGEAPLVRARREDLLDSVIPALADHFTEDTSNEQLFFWVYDHGVGPLQPGPVAERLGGSASRVGTRAAPGADAGAQVRILGRFTLPDGAPSLLPLNVAGANVKLQALLDELLGARELEATVRARAPITLGLRPGGKASSAIFDFLAPPDGKPRMRATVQSANGRDYRFQLTVDRGTIPGFPLVCDGLRPSRASLATAFTVNASSSATVLTVQDWRCLDLVGGQANQPRSLRLP